MNENENIHIWCGIRTYVTHIIITECSNPLDTKGSLKIDVDALGSVSELTRSFLAAVPTICDIGKVADESTSFQGTHTAAAAAAAAAAVSFHPIRRSHVVHAKKYALPLLAIGWSTIVCGDSLTKPHLNSHFPARVWCVCVCVRSSRRE